MVDHQEGPSVIFVSVVNQSFSLNKLFDKKEADLWNVDRRVEHL